MAGRLTRLDRISGRTAPGKRARRSRPKRQYRWRPRPYRSRRIDRVQEAAASSGSTPKGMQEGIMVFKPNYNQQRAERDRAKQAKKEAKLREREDAAMARRQTEQQGADQQGADQHGAGQHGGEPAAPESEDA